ncbi:MAG: transporter permease [Patescibacteria group bacterium]|nr:transporter permease [Patescibacteria group bacterium]
MPSEKTNNHGVKKHYTAIPLRMVIYIAWRNLVSKKLRTFLTIFGVIIGIGAIFFLLSFGLGIQNLVTKEIVGNSSVKSIDISSANSKVVQLNNEQVDKIKNLPHVEKYGLQYSFPGSMNQRGSSVDTIVYGVDQGYLELTDFSLGGGRSLKKEDNRVVMLNEAAVKAVGYKSNSEIINKKITLVIPMKDPKAKKAEVKDEFTVIGVVKSGAGSEVYVPSFIFTDIGVTSYTQMKLISDNSKNVAGLRSQIQSQGFETSSPSDTIEQINQIFKFFNVILVGFGAIGMIVAVLGMFNTLTISLLERTREIGLMMALGGRNRDMSKLFVLEAVLLSVAGAVIGITLAVTTGQIVNVLMNNFARNRGVKESFVLFSTPFWLIAALVGFMTVVGLLVAFFPAKRAHKINPIDALRRE